MFCRHCGGRNIISASFCKWCGSKIEPILSVPVRLQEKKKITNGKDDSFSYATFFVRSLAFVVDVVLSLYISILIYFFWEIDLAPLFTLVIYHIFFLSVYSSTPGKTLYGLKVLNEKNGEEIRTAVAIKRTLSYFISFTVLGLGFLSIITDKKRRQSWHDYIAKTVVFRRKDKSLILPAILSSFLVGSLAGLYFLGNNIYDGFEYLGRDSTIIHTAIKHLEDQDSSLCCLIARNDQISFYSKDIPYHLPRVIPLSSADIYQEFDKLVGIVKTDTGALGSGFNISPSGMIVTNYHVIEGSSKIVVAFVNNDNIEIYDVNLIIAQSKHHDIAVLNIDGNSLPYAVLGDSSRVFPGDHIYAIGNPAGYRNTISNGIISQLRSIDSVDYLQLTAPISPGSSGGPVVSAYGEVVGITTSFFIHGQNINFAVTINQLKELFNLSI